MCRADLRFVKLLRDQIHQSRAIQFSGHETILPGGNRNEKNTVQGPRSTRREASFFVGFAHHWVVFWSLDLTRFFWKKCVFKWKPPWNSDWFYRDMRDPYTNQLRVFIAAPLRKLLNPMGEIVWKVKKHCWTLTTFLGGGSRMASSNLSLTAAWVPTSSSNFFAPPKRSGLFSLKDKVIGLTHETREACHQLEVVEDIPNEILMTLFGGCPGGRVRGLPWEIFQGCRVHTQTQDLQSTGTSV